MKGHGRLVVFLLLLASSKELRAEDAAPADSSVGWACTFMSVIDGRSLILKPTRQEIDQSPRWLPEGSKEPPVSPGQAMRAAEAELSRCFRNVDDWSLTQIMLGRWCEDRWAWLLTWHTREPKEPKNMVAVPVLMSGVVVPLDRLAAFVEREAEAGGKAP